MITRYIAISLILGILYAAGCGNAVSAGEKVFIVTENFPPFNYPVGNEIHGIATQIVRKLFETADLPYRLIMVPWKRAYRRALQEPNTFIYTMAKTAPRRDKFHWIAKISNRKLSLFRLRSRQDLSRMTLEEAKTKAKIATVQGDASSAKLMEMGFSKRNLTLIHDSTQAINLHIKHVMKGRSDFFPMNPYSLQHRIQRGTIKDIFTEQVVIHDADGYYLAANIDTDPDILNALKDAYIQLAKQGFIEKVIGDYLTGTAPVSSLKGNP